MLFALYKIHFFCIFFQKNLHNSKKSSTFAVKLKKIQIKIYINKLNFKIMKTFVFVAEKAGKLTLRKCRVYEGELEEKEVSAHVFENEILVNFEYAQVCTF